MQATLPILSRTAPLALALAACVPTEPQLDARASLPASEAQLSVDGVAFRASLTAGKPGLVLTRNGAAPVAGLTVSVSRDGAPLGNDEGALAKKAARTACQTAGGQFQEAAIGGYRAAGLWSFPGACQ